MLYPLTFHPIFKERIWGGRNIERLYHKPLPPGLCIGESWEISDRPGDESVIANGHLAGRSLRWLMEHHSRDLLGHSHPAQARFPLLIKILDAGEKLSLQVHPPAHCAAKLGGEPKTEMWYVTHTDSRAELFVGLKHGVTRDEFLKHLADQTVADCFHRIPVKPGDAMFLPSGRVHALGAGIVLFEIQQNSDTTYRVFDWNRLDASGKSRELHIVQSLASINFSDFEPSLLPDREVPGEPGTLRPLVKDILFETDLRRMAQGQSLALTHGRMAIIAVTSGALRVASPMDTAVLNAGQFCLIPASCPAPRLLAESPVTFLEVRTGISPE